MEHEDTAVALSRQGNLGRFRKSKKIRPYNKNKNDKGVSKWVLRVLEASILIF